MECEKDWSMKKYKTGITKLTDGISIEKTFHLTLMSWRKTENSFLFLICSPSISRYYELFSSHLHVRCIIRPHEGKHQLIFEGRKSFISDLKLMSLTVHLNFLLFLTHPLWFQTTKVIFSNRFVNCKLFSTHVWFENN